MKNLLLTLVFITVMGLGGITQAQQTNKIPRVAFLSVQTRSILVGADRVIR